MERKHGGCGRKGEKKNTLFGHVPMNDGVEDKIF